MINSRNINDLHPTLQRAATEFLKRCAAAGLLVLITQTYRDNAYQNMLYAQGRTAPGSIVTNARGGQSMHNFRLAFDICKNIRGQEYSDIKFFNDCGAIWQDMGGVWGGNWSSFIDRPHMEFTGGLTLARLQKGETLSSQKMKWEQDTILTQPPPPIIEYKISEINLSAMVDAGVMLSPCYWRGISVKYLDQLLTNASQDGILDKRIYNGVPDVETALNVLVDAGVIISPKYWIDLVKLKNINHLSDLIINLANRCRIVIEKITQAEAGGEDLKGQTLVANVIMNRASSVRFPDSVYNVVFQTDPNVQFTPITNGAYERSTPSESVKKAVTNALNGTDYSQGALWFCTVSESQRPENWHERAVREDRIVFLFQYGKHRFYR